MSSAEEVKTSEQWSNFLRKDFKIIDPDGWDRGNWEFSWCVEQITKAEFERRAGGSTCLFPEKSFDFVKFNIWKRRAGK